MIQQFTHLELESVIYCFIFRRAAVGAGDAPKPARMSSQSCDAISRSLTGSLVGMLNLNQPVVQNMECINSIEVESYCQESFSAVLPKVEPSWSSSVAASEEQQRITWDSPCLIVQKRLASNYCSECCSMIDFKQHSTH